MNDLPPQTSTKALVGGAAGVVAVVATILGLFPPEVKATMGFWEWGAAIVGAFALVGAAVWLTSNKRTD